MNVFIQPLPYGQVVAQDKFKQSKSGLNPGLTFYSNG